MIETVVRVVAVAVVFVAVRLANDDTVGYDDDLNLAHDKMSYVLKNLREILTASITEDEKNNVRKECKELMVEYNYL